ncbi:MAG: DUF1552 domain-containing protein [Planctomycetota bacterium]
MKKSWQLDRRTFLRGSGVVCLAPYLEAMGPVRRDVEGPRRAAFVYFPNGCSLPNIGEERHRPWRWFPDGEGSDYRFTKVLEPLEPHRDDLSIYGGLSHPMSRELLGHLAGDSWLTGGDLRGGEYHNRVSVDQVAAASLGQHTRYPSFTFSTDGGVGYKSRVSTLSFDRAGKPIPSEHEPRAIFERSFAAGTAGMSEQRREELARERRVVDLMREDAKDLERVLGRSDRSKLEEFLESIRDLEVRIERAERWIDTPIPEFDRSHLDFSIQAAVDPSGYLRTMFDLMVLGFQLDLTRVMTFMMAREDGMGIGDRWPRLAVGVPRGHHTISHDQHDGHWEQWGRYDRWYAEQFAYFVDRMKSTSDEHGPLLDRSMILYGSCCSTTHNARNYPLAVAGGRDLGVRLGEFHTYSRTEQLKAERLQDDGVVPLHSDRKLREDDLPFGDLLLSMLRTLGVDAESFADSRSELPGFRR